MRALDKKIFPGFRLGELLAYVAFNYGWFILLGTIYIVGDRFNDKTFMPATDFVLINMFVIPVKMLLLLPFWWLYIVKWRNKPFAFKLSLHVLTGSVYSILMIVAVYIYFIYVVDFPYK